MGLIISIPEFSYLLYVGVVKSSLSSDAAPNYKCWVRIGDLYLAG